MGQIKYGSVCSGVEAATAAWHDLGWKPQWFSEIEKFPSAVLAHHYPDVPNFGDMTQYKDWPTNEHPIDLLVGGTPCQSFSVAGLRKGLEDPRGNLMLTYLAMAEQLKPKWLVWENVPGVLSSNGGKDFGTFLSALGQIGYGFAYRVLDAQYFGVAQRRRRVFVVGYLGDWKRAAAVLFEPESLSGDSAPSREKGEKPAPTVTQGAPFSGTGNSYVELDAYIPAVAGSLDTQCGGGKLTHQSANNGHLILERPVMGTITARMFSSLGSRDVEEGAIHPVAFDAYNQELTGAVSKTVASRADQDTASCIAFGAQNSASQGVGTDCYNGTITGDLAATLGTPGSSTTASGPTVMVSSQVRRLAPTAFSSNMSVPDCQTDGTTPTVKVGGHGGGNPPAVAFAIHPHSIGRKPNAGPQGRDHLDAEQAYTHDARGVAQVVAKGHQVRRLTPTECERLQGFPDNFTQIPWRNKAAEDCPDGPRYKAMGNSMAVPVMRWIGERIQKVEGTKNDRKEVHREATSIS